MAYYCVDSLLTVSLQVYERSVLYLEDTGHIILSIYKIQKWIKIFSTYYCQKTKKNIFSFKF